MDIAPSPSGGGRCSPLDRALEQRCDDLALEQDKDDQDGHQDQQRARAQQGDIGRVVALERSQRTGDEPLFSASAYSCIANWRTVSR